MLGIHRSDHTEASLLSNAGCAPQNPLLLLEKEGALEMTRLWGCAAWSKAGAERQGTGLTQLTSFILLVFSGYFGYLAMHREPTHIVGLSPFTSMLQADLCLCNTYGVSKCFGQSVPRFRDQRVHGLSIRILFERSLLENDATRHRRV